MRSARNKTIKQHLTTYQARLYYNRWECRQKRKVTIIIDINQKILPWIHTYNIYFLVTKMQLDSICNLKKKAEENLIWYSSCLFAVLYIDIYIASQFLCSLCKLLIVNARKKRTLNLLYIYVSMDIHIYFFLKVVSSMVDDNIAAGWLRVLFFLIVKYFLQCIKFESMNSNNNWRKATGGTYHPNIHKSHSINIERGVELFSACH